MSFQSPMSAEGASGPFKEFGLSDEDESTRLEVVARIIHATWDMAPNAEGEMLRPFVYWKTENVSQCAGALIKRCVIDFMSYFMYVLCPILLLTNVRRLVRAIPEA